MKNISRLSLLAALTLVSCDDARTSENPTTVKDAEIAALREKLEVLNKDLEAEEGDRAQLIAKYDVAIDSLKSSVEELDSKLSTVRAEKPAEVVKVVVVPKESAKEEQIVSIDIQAIRRAAIGETHDKVEISMGRVFYDVKITGIDDIGVRFSHRDGAARIDFMRLSSLWKERFYFDVGRFLKARKAERLARYRWEKSVDEKMAVVRAEKRKRADKERIAELEVALAQAKRPIQITQVAKSTSPRRSSSLDRYSSVVYPTYYGSGSSSSSYCPPATLVRKPTITTPVYRPTPVCPTPRPVIRPPVVRSTPICPTPRPVTRPPVVRSTPAVRRAPVVRSRYSLH